MRNINSNQKGTTNVKMDDGRVFDSTKAGVNDSNKNWNDFQTYYYEDEFKPKEKETKSTAEAAERGKAFVRGRLIILALQAELKNKTRSRKREMELA